MTRSRTGRGRFKPWARQVPQAARTDRARRRARRRNFRTLKVPPGGAGEGRGHPPHLTMIPRTGLRDAGTPIFKTKGPAFQPAQTSLTLTLHLERELHSHVSRPGGLEQRWQSVQVAEGVPPVAEPAVGGRDVVPSILG